MKTSIVKFGFMGVVMLILTSIATAENYPMWQGATGDWSTGSNWDVGEPVVGDFAYIDNGGTAQVTASGEATDRLYLGSGSGTSGTVDITSGDLSASLEYIGLNGTGTINHSGGSNIVSGFMEIGFSSAAHGTYNLSGTGSLTTPYMYVGESGTGSFIQSGGTHTVSSTLYFASEATSNGTYQLSDGTLSTGDVQIGLRGTGNFIQSGGMHMVSGSVYIGNFAESTGTYSISDGTLTIDGRLYMGYALSNATFKVTGADAGTITVKDKFFDYASAQLVSEIGSGGISLIDVTGVNGAGTADLDGTWNIVDLGSAPLGTFNILTAAGGIYGSFDTVSLPNADWSWGINDTAGADTLWVQHVPEPATLVLLGIGSLVAARRRRN